MDVNIQGFRNGFVPIVCNSGSALRNLTAEQLT